LENASVVHDNAKRREVLEEERIETADFFVACTGEDEVNMMMSVAAKDLGAKKVLAVIGRPDYSRITEKIGIDVAVSQQEAMSKQISAFLNEGSVLMRAKLPGGLISVLEIEVGESAACSKGSLAEISAPERCLVAAIMRQDQVFVPGASNQVKPGDIVVLLVEDDMIDQSIGFFS